MDEVPGDFRPLIVRDAGGWPESQTKTSSLVNHWLRWSKEICWTAEENALDREEVRLLI